MSHLSRRTLFQVSAGAALIPAMGVLRASAAVMVAQEMATDFWTFLNADARFTIWVRLIAASGLESGARSATQFTTFVPTDDALSAVPAIQQLLAYQDKIGSRQSASNFFPDTSKIVSLIRSHVVMGKHLPSEATGGVMTVNSLDGTPVTVDTGKHPATVSWKSVVTGQSLVAALTDTPVNTINAVIYPVDAIGFAM